MRSRSLLSTLALVLVILASAAPAHATPAYQPDLVSGTSGDGLYGPDPAQRSPWGATSGFGIAYAFDVQNDGSRTDTFRLRLRGSGDPDVTAMVTVDTRDVTASFSPGPYRVRHLAPGETFTFMLGIAATVSATTGDTHTFRLVARSAGNPIRRDVWVFDAVVL